MSVLPSTNPIIPREVSVKSLQRMGMVVVLLGLTGCASMGAASKTDGLVSVAFGEQLLKNTQRVEVLKEYNLIETLHGDITDKLSGSKKLKSTKVDVVITSMLLRISRFNKSPSRMDYEVTAYEGANVILKFTSSVHSSKRKSKAMNRMSRAITRDIYIRLRDAKI